MDILIGLVGLNHNDFEFNEDESMAEIIYGSYRGSRTIKFIDHEGETIGNAFVNSSWFTRNKPRIPERYEDYLLVGKDGLEYIANKADEEKEYMGFDLENTMAYLAAKNYNTAVVDWEYTLDELDLTLDDVYGHPDIRLIKGTKHNERRIQKEKLQGLMDSHDKKYENKGESKMNLDTRKILGDLRFGKADARFKLSMNGIAVADESSNYQVFDPKSNTLIDVAGLTFDFDALYVMPTNEVKVGDIVLHRNSPIYVTAVESGAVEGISYKDGTIIKTPAIKNIFGFNFYSKVVSLFGDFNVGTSEGSNPFGNLMGNPMMMMMLMGDGNTFGGGRGNSGNLMELFMMTSLMGGSNPFDFGKKSE